MRLDTDNLINEIKDFLKGKKTLIKQVEGRIVTETIKYGEEQVNETGFQQIMAFITSIINPHTVQGNYDETQYSKLIYRIHTKLAYLIVSNYDEWGIKAINRSSMITYIITLVEIFLSRTINNEERKSYGNTIHTHESNTVQTPNSWLPSLGQQ